MAALDPGSRCTASKSFGEVRWAEFGPGAVGIGWELGFMGLALHVTSGATLDRDDHATWIASAEGRRFMTLSSDGWCDARIAAGEARAAANRTTAAYTAG